MALDGVASASPRKQRVRRALTGLCGLLILAYLLVPPLPALRKANLVGYSICHQIPERSFHPGGVQLPLCARCTGTYIGVATGLGAIALLRRWRVGQMLPTGMIIVMVSFIGIMGVDGLNSYLSLFPNMPHLYVPRNWSRAASGSLNGIALSMIVFPVFNYTLWRRTDPGTPLKNVWELLPVLAVDAAAVAIVQSEPAWLLYPVALLTVGGVLWMLTMVNTMILAIVLRHDSQADTWRDAALPILGGLAVTLLELTTMGTLRYLITGTLGWPLAV